jgi:uncharacterized protein (TIGR02300 family)
VLSSGSILFDRAHGLWQCAPPVDRPRIVVGRCLFQPESLVYKPEWGTKHQCPKCGARFYDLGHADPVHCIACGNEWVPEPILKSKQPLAFEDAKPVEVAAAEPGEETDLIVDDDLAIDDAEESVGDVSLDDDDSDLAEVVDNDREDE